MIQRASILGMAGLKRKGIMPLALLAGLLLPASAYAQWSAVAPLPAGRSQAAVASDGAGQIHVIGGFDANGSPTSLHEVYNPATNTSQVRRFWTKQKSFHA